MSHLPRLVLTEILQRISALYRVNHITSQTRNELVALAQKGGEDRFDALYLKCTELPDHQLLDEIKEIIIFQG